MRNIFLSLYPLQINITNFSLDRGGQSSSNIGVYIAFVVIAIIITIIIIYSAKKSGAGGKGGGGAKLFSGFALRRLIRNAGLNSEQIRMLNFVFKADSVAEPEKSLSNPSLLDRHFRRAYRVIEGSSKNEQDTQRKLSVLFSTRNTLESSPMGSISSTRQIRDDTALIINTGRDKLKVSVLANKSEYFAVNTPKTVLGSEIKFEKGAKLNILYFSKSNKGFSFETRVSGHSNMHGHSILQLAHTSHIKLLSQRRFRRKQAVIACYLSLVYVEGSGKKQRLIVDKRRLNGSITDISVGGCSIKTTASVHVGARFKVEFTQGDNNISALGQVLRTNRAGVNTIVYMRFIRSTQKSMNLINAFVFDIIED